MRRGTLHRPGLVAALVVLAVLTISSGLPGVAWGLPHAPTSVGGSTGTHLVPASGGTSTPPATPPPIPTNCSALDQHYASVFEGLAAPPAVAPNLASPCSVGPDEASLTFLSNASTAASRTEISVTLPPLGAAVGSVLGSFSIRTWVSGVPCSVYGASALVARFVPPLSPYDPTPSTNWSVRPAAYDLVPSASCDPFCANATALVTVQGATYCEDDLLRDGALPTNAPTASFAPGDSVTVTIVGSNAAGVGESVYLNDSSSPSASRAWNFGGGTTVTGEPLQPFFNASTASDQAWGDAGAVAAVWTNCPILAAGASCLSYDGPLLATVSPVRVTSELAWDPSTHAYDLGYGAVVPASSTAGCTSATLSCASFRSGGGTGAYPYFTLERAGAGTFWAYGTAGTTTASSFGGPAAQFPASGNPTFSAAILGPIATSSTLSALSVSIPVVDGGGATAVNVSAYYCPTGSVPSVRSLSATLSTGGTNSSSDGVWTASFPLSGSTGTYPVWVRVQTAGDAWSAPAFTYPAVSGGGTVCNFTAPMAPSFTPANVTAIANGYRLGWNDTDPAIIGYTVNLTGAQINVSQSLGPVLATRIYGGFGGIAYNLTVVAHDAANQSSAPVTVAGPSEAFPLNLAVGYVEKGGAYAADPTVTLSTTLLGGVGPYDVATDFGDGTAPALGSTTGSLSQNHTYVAYQGTAELSLTAVDAVGDVATFAVPVPVVATPLGVPQSAAAGDGFVDLNWSSPYSLASPLLGFVVSYSFNASQAGELANGAYGNGTVPGVTVWQTRAESLTIAVPDGGALYAQVLGRNAYGLGALPAGDPVLVGRPAPFVVSPIADIAGGPAPFTDAFSAVASGGSNDTLSDAIYSFPGGVSVTPTIADVNGTFYVNASETFPGPGTYPVVLHVVDLFLDVGIEITNVYVSPGAPPQIAIGILNAPSYNGSAIDFLAQASGGSGTYAYNWSFGDGGASNGTSPVHTYRSPGTYSVVVRVTDNVTGGTNVSVVPVTVFTAPVVFVSVTPGTAGPLTYDFVASVGGGSGRSHVVWSFGDGGVSNGFNVTHQYNTTGTYLVNVTAQDPSGRSGTSQYYLVVTPSGSGGGSGVNGWPSYVVVGLALVAGAAILFAVYAFRSRPPPARPVEPVGGYEEEDGEVTLT